MITPPLYQPNIQPTGPGADRVVMFQEHGLYPWLNVLENVKFGMKLAGVPKDIQEEKAMHYLEMVHLQDYKRFPIYLQTNRLPATH